MIADQDQAALSDSPVHEGEAANRESELVKTLKKLVEKYSGNVDKYFTGSKTQVLANVMEAMAELNAANANVPFASTKKETAELGQKTSKIIGQFTEKLTAYLESEKAKLNERNEAIVKLLLGKNNLADLLSSLDEYAKDADESVKATFAPYVVLVRNLYNDVQNIGQDDSEKIISKENILDRLKDIKQAGLKNHLGSLLHQELLQKEENILIDRLIVEAKKITNLDDFMSLLSKSNLPPVIEPIKRALENAKQKFDSNESQFFAFFGLYDDGKQAEIKSLAIPLIKEYVEMVNKQREQELNNMINEVKELLIEQLEQKAVNIITSALEGLSKEGFLPEEKVDLAIKIAQSKIKEAIQSELTLLNYGTPSKLVVNEDLDFLRKNGINRFLIQDSTDQFLSDGVKTFAKKINQIILDEARILDFIDKSLKPGFRTEKHEVITSVAVVKNNGRETNEQVEARQFTEIKEKYIIVLSKRILVENDKLKSSLKAARKIGLLKNSYLNLGFLKDFDQKIVEKAQQEAINYLSEMFGFDMNILNQELDDLHLKESSLSITELTDAVLTNKKGQVELLDPKLTSKEHDGLGNISLPEEIYPFGRSFSSLEVEKKKELVNNFLEKGWLRLKIKGFVDSNTPTGFRQRIEATNLFPYNEFNDLDIHLDVKSLLTREVIDQIVGSIEGLTSERQVEDEIEKSIKESDLFHKKINEINSFVQQMVKSMIQKPEEFLAKIKLSPEEGKHLSHDDWFKIIIAFVKGRFDSGEIDDVTSGFSWSRDSIKKTDIVRIAGAARNTGK
jgi:hypothetical protein